MAVYKKHARGAEARFGAEDCGKKKKVRRYGLVSL
jgi:hypothetical protein